MSLKGIKGYGLYFFESFILLQPRPYTVLLLLLLYMLLSVLNSVKSSI